MAFEVVPTAARRLHSDQYTKIIIINTPINLRAHHSRVRMMMKPEPGFDMFPCKPARAPAPTGKFQGQVSHWRAPTPVNSRVWPE